MAIAKVKKINILSHIDYENVVLEVLHNKGFIEIIEKVKEKEDKSDAESRSAVENENIEYKLAKVKYAIEFLSGYKEDKRGFLEKMTGEKRNISQADMDNLMKEYDYSEISEMAEKLSQKLNSDRNLILKLREEKKGLEPWKELELLTASGMETDTSRVNLGFLDIKSFDGLMERIGSDFKEAHIEEVGRRDNFVYLQVVYLKTIEKEISALLSEYEFKDVDLPEIDKSIGDYIRELDGKLKDTESSIEKQEEEARKMAESDTAELEAVSDYLSWQRDKRIAQNEFDFTGKTFRVTGWIKESRLDELRNDLREAGNVVEVEELDMEDGENPPIIMENSKLIEPVEFVTNIYGYPNYREVDPTPFLAGFFIVFFGLCLTDAGYGITLAVITFLALKFLKISGGFKKLLKVLFYGSILTIIAGGLTGGWFGIVLDDLVGGKWGWMARPLIALREIDPVKDPLTMLVFSIILGYLHLLFGNFIDLWWKVKNGRKKEGLLKSGVWIYFLLMVGLWILNFRGILSLGKLPQYLLYSAIILIIFTQGEAKNPIMKVFGGLAGLYFGISGYVSDILSYSRLLALGLATGIIGMVINIVGMMVYEKIPYIGWLLMVMVLIGGHLMNLVISLVGAFVHSGRLQYVEFFKIFFEGGGKEFAPFVKNSKYINLINKK